MMLLTLASHANINLLVYQFSPKT